MSRRLAFSGHHQNGAIDLRVKDRPEIGTLAALAAAETSCTRCPLFRDATQVVPGEGSAKAAIMLVGEQPGDR